MKDSVKKNPFNCFLQEFISISPIKSSLKMINNELVMLNSNNEPTTTSLMVAEKFGKEHKFVMRDIRTLIDGVCPILD